MFQNTTYVQRRILSALSFRNIAGKGQEELETQQSFTKKGKRADDNNRQKSMFLLKFRIKMFLAEFCMKKKMQITKYVALWFRRGKKISQIKPRFCF